ncbi:MAG: DUF4389 domain-containing protein, partial [Ilumatobacteraceae bacterium]
MAQAVFTVEYTADRSRSKNLFRVILAIPHMIIVQAWQQLVQVVTLFQWFIILFTGQRNQAIWKLQNDWLAYASR